MKSICLDEAAIFPKMKRMIQTPEALDISKFGPPLPSHWTHSPQRLEIPFAYAVKALLAAVKGGAVGSSPQAKQQTNECDRRITRTGGEGKQLRHYKHGTTTRTHAE